MHRIHRTSSRRIITAATIAASGFALFAGGHAAHALTPGTTEYRTSASFGAINYEFLNAPTAPLYGDSQYSGASLNTSGNASYSFGEGKGSELGANSDTITLSGSGAASSQGFGFTDLKARVTANLSNAYLNLRDVANAPTEGSGLNAPYNWIANVSAGWTLNSRLTNVGNIGNHTVKYIFRVDGVENTNTGGYSFAYLGFSYGTNRANFSTTSLDPQMWATDSYNVAWGSSVETTADFNANWQYNLVQDGEAVYGEDDEGNRGELIGYRAPASVGGTANYYSTLTLADIQVSDENGNRFYDFTVDDGAGGVYFRGVNPNAGVAAPEPGTLALLGLGLTLGIPALYRRLPRRAA